MDNQIQPNPQNFQPRPAVPNALPQNQRPKDNLVTRANKIINRDVILLGVIAILLLVILGMSAFVLSSVTNSGVNVSFTGPEVENNTDNQNSDSAQDSQTPVSNQDSSIDDQPSQPIVTTSELTVYMVSTQHQGDLTSLPPGSKQSQIEGVFLVPVLLKLEKASDVEDLQAALNELFGQEVYVYQNVSLQSFLSLSDVETNVTIDSNSALIDLVGDLRLSGDLSGQYIREQLENTISEYVSDYVITLNGSAVEYECFDDASGLCG